MKRVEFSLLVVSRERRNGEEIGNYTRATISLLTTGKFGGSRWWRARFPSVHTPPF